MKKRIGLKQAIAGCAIVLSALLSFAQTTDVYFVGNSYTSTYDVPTVFSSLAVSGGHPVKTGNDIIGGAPLSDHWAAGKATNDITTGHYDYVVLQESSTINFNSGTQSNFDMYAPMFDAVITNSGAQTVLYMPWPDDDMYSSITNSIRLCSAMAKRLNCRLAPVSEAWNRVRQQYPAIDLYSADPADGRHHQNQKGTYLVTCNLYGAIFNESPEGISMRTVGGFVVDAAEAAVLQRIAWDAVQFFSFTNPPIITSMTVDQAVRTNNTPFTFQASASDNGSITDYLWSFGDGTTTNGPALTNVTHTYVTDGVFPVTVKVTDNSGETERFGLTVTRDTTGPQISSITAASQMLTVRFNQEIQQAGAETAINYTISGGSGITVFSATQSAPDTVRLTVSTLSPGVDYVLTVNNLYNALGVKIFPNTFKNFMYMDGSNLHLRFDFGTNAYLTAGNWNNVTSGEELAVTNAIDIYGVPRDIIVRGIENTLLFTTSSGMNSSNLYPASAQRDCIAKTRKFTYQIEGVDPVADYKLTFFASKGAATRETLYTVGSSNAVLDTAYNSNRVAVIENVKSDANGHIRFTVDTNAVNSSGWCYLSVLELEAATTADSKLIETSLSSLDIAEGTTSNFMVRLSSQPSEDVTVSVIGTGYAHVQVLSESAFLYFSATNWNIWQPVYVEAINDADLDNGTATIQLTDSGDMYTSASVSATQIDDDVVLVVPSAGFTPTPSSGTAPLSVTFTDTSAGSITNRFWDFGDGSTTNTTATSVAHTYASAGTNTVQLIVSGPLGVSTNTQIAAVTVTLPAAPVAGFSATPTSGTAPLTVIFTDTSTGSITNRYWSFGDGGTTNTTATSVAHTYTAAGTNTVQLIVSGSGGAGTNTQANLISVTVASPGSLVHLDLSSAFDYDAFITAEEINYASNNGPVTVVAKIGDHGVYFTSRTTSGISHLVDPDAALHKGVPVDGIVAGGKYVLANGLTTKWGTATGDTKVNNTIGRPYLNGDTGNKTATVTLAAADQKKYRDLNILVNGTRYGTRAATLTANLEVQYVGDANWYSVWFESVDISAGASGGTFGAPMIGTGKQSSAWVPVTVGDGYGKKGTLTTIRDVGSSVMWELATPAALDENKVLQSFRMTATTPNAGYYNEFFLFAASATGTESAPSGDTDSDGIPDEWEMVHFGGSTNANPHAMAANGVNTILETYVADLNPTNAQSVFAVSSQQLASQRVLQWNAVSGRVCSVYWTTNLLNSFHALETNVLWPQNSWTDTVHGAQDGGYYRIGIQVSP